MTKAGSVAKLDTKNLIQDPQKREELFRSILHTPEYRSQFLERMSAPEYRKHLIESPRDVAQLFRTLRAPEIRQQLVEWGMRENAEINEMLIGLGHKEDSHSHTARA